MLFKFMKTKFSAPAELKIESYAAPLEHFSSVFKTIVSYFLFAQIAQGVALHVCVRLSVKVICFTRACALSVFATHHIVIKMVWAKVMPLFGSTDMRCCKSKPHKA
jgi:hypothetical protein